MQIGKQPDDRGQWLPSRERLDMDTNSVIQQEEEEEKGEEQEFI